MSTAGERAAFIRTYLIPQGLTFNSAVDKLIRQRREDPVWFRGRMRHMCDCGAKAGQVCRTTSGNVATFHTKRGY
jgi:hypothetical protein